MTITKRLQEIIELLGGSNTSDNLITTKLNSIIELKGGTQTSDNLIASKLRYIAELLNGSTESSLYTEMIADIIAALGGKTDSRLITEQLDMIVELLKLPMEYQRIAYLQSDGNACINTGINFEYSMDIDLQFEQSNTRTLYGSGLAVANYFGKNAENKYELGSGVFIDEDATIRRTIRIERDSEKIAMKIGSNSVERYNQLLEPYLFLFNTNGDTESLYKGTSRIFGAIIYQNGSVVRNFIPYIRKSDSVAGLYDTVGNVFYTNVGTGEFIIPT